MALTDESNGTGMVMPVAPMMGGGYGNGFGDAPGGDGGGAGGERLCPVGDRDGPGGGLGSYG